MGELLKPIPIELGRKQYLPNGFKIESQIINPLKKLKTKGNTARHEALHAVVGEKTGSSVEEVSIIVPGPGYLGITKFTEFNAAAAVAADEGEENGTQSDVEKVRYSAANEGAARAVAKNIIARNAEHIEAVGGLLVEKGTITGGEVRSVMRRVDEGEDVSIRIKKPNGEEKREIIRGIKGETVMVPEKWLTIEQAETPSNISPFPQKPAESLAQPPKFLITKNLLTL